MIQDTRTLLGRQLGRVGGRNAAHLLHHLLLLDEHLLDLLHLLVQLVEVDLPDIGNKCWLSCVSDYLNFINNKTTSY